MCSSFAVANRWFASGGPHQLFPPHSTVTPSSMSGIAVTPPVTPPATGKPLQVLFFLLFQETAVPKFALRFARQSSTVKCDIFFAISAISAVFETIKKYAQLINETFDSSSQSPDDSPLPSHSLSPIIDFPLFAPDSFSPPAPQRWPPPPARPRQASAPPPRPPPPRSGETARRPERKQKQR